MPASSSGGILLATGAGNATITAPLTLNSTNSPSQTWNVTDSTSTLNISGSVTFGASMVKSGAGALTLSGNNSGTGNITLSAGTLNINSSTALGGGTLAIGAGTTIDNNAAATPVVNANNNAQIWNGSFTFTGTNALDMGTGAVTLANNAAVTTSTSTAANTLTIGGVISDGASTFSLTKAGPGTLILNGNNTYKGLTTVSLGTLVLAGANTGAGGVTLSAGALQINNAGALGTGTFTVGGGTIDNTTGGVVVNAVPITLAGSFTFAGSNNMDLGTGATSLTATPTITTAANTLTLSGSITGGANGLTKAGPGTLTLSGTNNYSGNTSVNAGTLNITGSLTGNPGSTILNYGPVAGNAIVNQTGTTTLFSTQGGNISGAVSVYNQTAGTVTVTPGTGNSQYVVKAINSYGDFNLSGGTYRDSTGLAGGARFDVNGLGSLGVATAAATAATGVVYVSGTGFLDHTNAEWFINGYSLGQITVADSGKIDHTGSNNPFAIFMDSSVTGGAYGVLNIAGANAQVITGAQPLRFGNSTTNGAGNSGFVNVAAGTLSTGANFSTSLPAAPTTINNIYVNFAGGTVKSTATLSSWITATSASVAVNSTIFGAVDNSAIAAAPSFSGGVTFDTNTFNITIATPLAAATAAGVTQANLTVAGGAGYVGAPAVVFSSTGVVTGGTPAAGYALISGGVVTGIVITAPGTYTAGTIPTVTLIGGGGTGASITASALSTSNVSGGLTKINTGSLILSGANTYTGTTQINGGVLQLGAAGTTGTLSLSSAIVNNANLTFNRSNAVAQGTDFSAAPITGSGSVTQASASTVTLNAINTYQGGTTVSGATGSEIIATNSSALGASTGALTLASTQTGTGLTFQVSGSGLNIANPIVMTSTTGRENIQSIGGNNAISGGITINATAASANALVIDSGTAATTFTVSGPITASAQWTGGISLRGNSLATSLGTLSSVINMPSAPLNHDLGGIWTIASTGNIYSATSFNSTIAGTGFQLGVTDALATASRITWIAASTDFVDLNGFNQTVIGLDLVATTGNPAIGNSSTTSNSLLTINAGATTYTYAGKIVDSLVVGAVTGTKQVAVTISNGKQILSGGNTFTGTTTVSAPATLQLGAGAGTGTLAPAGAIVNNGVLVVNHTDALTQGTGFSSAPITGPGSFQNIGTGSTVFTAANAYQGTTTISTGTVQLGAGGTSGSLATTSTIIDNGTFAVNRTDTVIQGTAFTSSPLSGTGGVTNAGTGTTVLTVTNTYQGTSLATAGILQVGNGGTVGTLGTGPVVATAGGTIGFDHSDTYTPSSGNLFTGAGNVSIIQGTLATSQDGQFAMTGSLLVGAGTTVGNFVMAGNEQFGGLGSPVNEATRGAASSTITVAGGKTLTITGAVTLGVGTTTTNFTNVAVSGAGTLTIGTSTSSTNANVQLGVNATTNISNAVTLDLTGLANFSTFLGTGTFFVGEQVNSGGTGTAGSILKLSPNTSITAATISQDSPDGTVTQDIQFGTGTNLLNANTINIGGSASRAVGTFGVRCR